MNRLTFTYALIKSLYEQGEDYVDSFWPFAIKTLAPKKSSDLNMIQKILKERYNLDVPLYVLGVILTRAKRKGYVTQTKKRYILTQKGINYLDALEVEEEVDRRINALYADIQKFFNEHNFEISSQQLQDLLLSFVRRNIEPLIECINPAFTADSLLILKTGYTEQLLVEYITTAEHQKPECYSTLQDMILGSIISVILYAPEASDVSELGAKKLKACRVYLDTNFVFSVLELHTPEFNEPAKELFDILENNKYDIRVFDFTIDEICRVINGYIRKANLYPTTIRVDTLYSGLKRKGWTKTDVYSFVSTIEEVLHNKGIAVEWNTRVDIKSFNPKNPGLRSALRRYKPVQDIIHQNHDLAAIEYIDQVRKKAIRKIDDAPSFFLTSDVRLSRFNFIEMEHKSNATVCECMLDRLLTNILWLKNPHLKPPIKSIISAYSRNFFVRRRIWEKFYEILKELKKSGKANDDNIAMLFYHGYIEEVLLSLDESELDNITPNFVLAEIEKASRLIDEKVLAVARSKEAEFIETLNKEVSATEHEVEQKWLEKFEESRVNLKKISIAQATKRTNIYTLLISLPVIIITYLVFRVLNQLGLVGFWNFAIPVLAGGSGLIGLWKKIREKIKNTLLDKIYQKKLIETKLDSINEVKK